MSNIIAFILGGVICSIVTKLIVYNDTRDKYAAQILHVEPVKTAHTYQDGYSDGFRDGKNYECKKTEITKDGTLWVTIPAIDPITRIIIDEEQSAFCKVFYSDTHGLPFVPILAKPKYTQKFVELLKEAGTAVDTSKDTVVLLYLEAGEEVVKYGDNKPLQMDV